MPVGGIVEVPLSEDAVRGKTLGRHIQHDPRSRNFPARRAAAVKSVKHQMAGLPLDQEAHTCPTAHALCATLGATGRADAESLVTSPAAVRVYERAKKLEGAESVLVDEKGSSGLMACKAARSMGLIDSYEHAFGVEHALRALVLRPVITGFRWYSSFDHPDPETGLVEITEAATVRGGHEVVADEIDLERGLVWFWNSWGPSFGLEGRFCMTFDTWERLLVEEGDVTVPVV
jgi:hypothetical protein